MGPGRRTASGVLLCVLGALVLLVLAVPSSAGAWGGAAAPSARVQESPSAGAQPSETSPPPTEEPPTAPPSPTRSPTPRPTCGTLVCPTLTPRPSPSRTRAPTPTPEPAPSEDPTEPADPTERPDPLETRNEPEPTAPEPVLPTVQISELPVAPPSFDETSTEEPSPLPSSVTAAEPGSGRTPAQLLLLALAVVAVLGSVGAAGLYLTREPKDV